MVKTKSTKRALLMSALALIACVSMLIGSTYAWFTDSVTSAGNKIVAGTLDVQLLMNTGAGYVDISDSTDPIFGEGALAQNNNAETLWEPGKTQVAYLAIKNNGSLALKYTVGLSVQDVAKSLYEVMEYAIVPDAQYNTVTAWNGGNTVVVGSQSVSGNVSLAAGATHYFALAIHMDEDAGNEYQGGMVNFDLTVLATQDTVEADSFNNQYDAGATYDSNFAGSATAIVTEGTTAVELEIRDTATSANNAAKIASAVVPTEAIAGDSVSVSIKKTDLNANITIDADDEFVAYDVTVTGLKDNNTTPVTVSLRAPAGLDPNTVKLYHKDTEIASNYDPHTGYVTFQSATFSPFTVVYDAESEYVPTDPEGNNLPVANVVNSPEYENVDLPWENYSGWSPTEGLDARLEAAYTFSCKDTPEEAEASDYANWYCDFYVKLDRDLGENEIFLGGNYGSFGWVGFHNGELTLEADTEIPLLGSVTTNPWTYDQVASAVGTFICGVGDVDDALSGATFTVMLRLTNPVDETEFYNVATINYTFE